MASDPNIVDRARQMAVAMLRRTLLLRARAYKRVFKRAGIYDRDVEIVLADMRDFCRGNATTFSTDPYSAARMQGRREAWLRLTQHLNLDEEQVQKLVELDDGN